MKDLRTNRKLKINVINVSMHDAHVVQHDDVQHVLLHIVKHFIINLSRHLAQHVVNQGVVNHDAHVVQHVFNPVVIIEVIYCLFSVDFHSPLNPTFFLFLFYHFTFIFRLSILSSLHSMPFNLRPL